MHTEQTQAIRQGCQAYVDKMHWHLAKETTHSGGCYLQITDGSRKTVISISSRGKVGLQGKKHVLYQQIQHDLKQKVWSDSTQAGQQEGNSFAYLDEPEPTKGMPEPASIGIKLSGSVLFSDFGTCQRT
jgi:hypothetical protein